MDKKDNPILIGYLPLAWVEPIDLVILKKYYSRLE